MRWRPSPRCSGPAVLAVLLLVQALPAAAGEAGDAGLPSSGRWLAHAEFDLGGFWLDSRYHGDPVGAFPTFIGPDGCAWTPAAPCTSLAGAPEWIASELGRRYVRMVSRQVYTYGVIFHLTGDPVALDLARAGARWILDTAYDPATGSVATWFAADGPDPEPAARSTQSLAYALLGPAFLYHLTGDPELLAYVRRVKEHIFADHWSEELGMLRWSRVAAGHPDAGRIELVSQLDQINAYMLVLTPLLAGEERAAWEADLRRLVTVLLRAFHDPEQHRFAGYLHEPAGRIWGQRHNDFGHTAKAYWMVERVGALLDEPEWVDLARTGLADVLEDALVRRHVDVAPDWQRAAVIMAADEDGTYWVWSNRADGLGIAWWEWCELDQAAATLALDEPRWSGVLARTLPTWFGAMVDPASGAVLPFPGDTTSPRAHHWMNGYHAAEHALVGYLTSSWLAGETPRLYFAPRDASHPLRASFFAAELAGRETVGTTGDGWPVVEARFVRR
jgi:mannose/cellobiose epimerase-like protein (N-acyl-D-glucosamine 2-epimerase family)